jgi:parvulin-like peptidyl-prolyl isomerase
MKKIALAISISGLLITACFFGPGKNDNSPTALGRVDGKLITAAEMDSLAGVNIINITDTTDIQALKTALIDTLIDAKIVEMLADSIALTLENDLQFKESREQQVSNAVLRSMFEGEITANVNVDSAEIDNYYNDHKEQYKKSEEIHAAHILIPPPPPDTIDVKSKEEKQKIIAAGDKDTYKRARAVYDKAVAGENWDSLVVKYSQDGMTNKKGGDLGYFARGRMVAPFDSAAFAANVGDIVGPVKTRFGYHIIKIEDRTPEGYRDLDEQLRGEIKTQLTSLREKELADQFLDSLKAEAAYQFNDSVLAMEDSLVSPETWVMVVNSTDTVYENRMQRDFPKYKRFHQMENWTVDDKINMLKEISATNLLRAAGRKLGYYDKPKAVEAKEIFTRREAETRATNFLRDLEYKPSEEEIGDYYKENFDSLYKERKPLHVQHIIFEDSALAAAVRDSILAGADFKEMALKYYPGEPEIREVAFDLGYISEDELGANFFEHANALEVGDVSEPFKTEWGYHIVKLVNRRADKKMDQVRPAIRKALMEAADSKIRSEYLAKKRSQVVIELNDKAIKKYKFPDSLYSTEITPKG